MDGKFIAWKLSDFFSYIGYLLIAQCTMSFLQLSQSPLDKRPSYDGSQGANVTPTTFYNIGDLEIQDNLARFWYGDYFEIQDNGYENLFIYF